MTCPLFNIISWNLTGLKSLCICRCKCKTLTTQLCICELWLWQYIFLFPCGKCCNLPLGWLQIKEEHITSYARVGEKRGFLFKTACRSCRQRNLPEQAHLSRQGWLGRIALISRQTSVVRTDREKQTLTFRQIAQTWTQTYTQVKKPCLAWPEIDGLIAVNEKQVCQQVAGKFPNRKSTKWGHGIGEQPREVATSCRQTSQRCCFKSTPNQNRINVPQ